MSTAATISPYEPVERTSIAGDVAAGVAGAVVTAGEALKDLLSYDDRQKEILERYREEQSKMVVRHETLNAKCMDLKTASTKLKPVSVTIKLRNVETLVMSAESLGFKLSPLASSHKPLDCQSTILLTGTKGEKLAFEKNRTGRLVVKSNSGAAVITELVKKHSLDMVERHLKKNYGELQVEKTPNGDIAFVSGENKKGPDGQAIVTAVVKSDGEIAVDVSNIKGKRCEAIIQDLARAVGGECVKSSRKKEYFQQVEERGKVRV